MDDRILKDTVSIQNETGEWVEHELIPVADIERLVELGIIEEEPRHKNVIKVVKLGTGLICQELSDLKSKIENGFQGGCWCCETVAENNIRLAARVKDLDQQIKFWKEGLNSSDFCMQELSRWADEGER